MYDDKDYGFNWIGLFIKIIIIVLIILLGIWIVSKVFLSYSDKDLEKDMKSMKIAASKYFTTDKVPSEVGDSAIITLDELIKKKLITSKTIKSCDKDESLAKVTKFEEYYKLKVELQCGKKESSSTIKFTPKDSASLSNSTSKDSTSKNSTSKNSSKNKTKDSNNKTNNETKNNDTNSDNVENKDNSDNTNTGDNSNKTLYYEFAKIKYKSVTNEYASYCKAKSEGKEYYSLSYINSGSYNQGFNYNYKVEVKNLPSNYKNVRVTNTRIFTSLTDFNSYVISRNNLSMVGSNSGYSTAYDANVYKVHSLSGGFTPTVTYSSGNVVNIAIKINSKMSVSAYNGKIFVPVGFTLIYDVPDNSKCISDLSSNAGNYSNYFKTKTYTSVTNVEDGLDYNDIKWSTSNTMSGYKKTGKTEYR